MILTNKLGENKIFIDEALLEEHLIINNVNDKNYIRLKTKIRYKINFSKEKISASHADGIYYNTKENKLCIFDDNGMNLCEKTIDEDEIISFSLGDHDEEFQIIELTSMRLPKFYFENNFDDKYPKFEVNLSDCVYSMRIYLNDGEYIDIPEFQSHYSIHDTLEYINQLVFYVTLGRPDFIKQLCEYNSMDLLIYDASHEKALSGGEVKYKLGEEGLYLTGGELDNFLVEWNRFFKLVIDGTWEVDFYDAEPTPQPAERNYDHVCDTCANYTDPDEVDNGCYMCCKGLEDNYVPIEKE